ncbi:MAG: hypothetical protein KAJ10_14030 [Thermodesulfovibrionia bacterium]|nr:hypothetical protein [Thermodesulfovibrionia bacterium]
MGRKKQVQIHNDQYNTRYQDGNWVPIDKTLLKALPKSRKYEPVEAVLSYQVDVNNNTVQSYRAYSRIWGWSVNRVINFIKNKRVTVSEHPKNTRETVKFRIFGESGRSKRHLNDKGKAIADQSQDTTIIKNKTPEASLGSLKEIAEKIDILREKVNKDKFNPIAFITKCRKLDMPAELINAVLEELIKYSDSIDNFWGYAIKILKREEGNYHYAKNLEQHYAIKESEINSAKDILENLGLHHISLE